MHNESLGDGLYVSEQQRNAIHQAFHRTHFRLSHADQEELTTTQKSHYKGLNSTEIGKSDAKSSIFQSHWKLGYEKNEMETEIQASFKPVDLGNQSIAASRATGDRKNYHDCHISLGYDTGPLETSSQGAYQPYDSLQIPTKHSKNIVRGLIRLGTDAADYSTEAKSGLMPKAGDVFEVGKRRQAAKKKNETASIVLGSGSADLAKSSSALAFDWKRGSKAEIQRQGSHIALGEDQPTYESFSHASYLPVPSTKARFQSQVLTDLRKSHFRLGDYKEKAESKGPIPQFHASVSNPQTQISSVHLGGFASSWDSSSATVHKPLPVALYQPQVKADVTTSHISLGNGQTASLKSVNQDLFDDAFKQDPRVSAVRRAKGQKDTIELGRWKTDYTRVSESYGEGAAHPIASHSFDTDSGKHHFRLGFSSVPMERSSAQAKPTHVARVSLDSKTMQRLTSTSAVIGHSNTRSFSSTYSHSFQWIHPSVDSHYSVSYN